MLTDPDKINVNWKNIIIKKITLLQILKILSLELNHPACIVVRFLCVRKTREHNYFVAAALDAVATGVFKCERVSGRAYDTHSTLLILHTHTHTHIHILSHARSTHTHTFSFNILSELLINYQNNSQPAHTHTCALAHANTRTAHTQPGDVV